MEQVWKTSANGISIAIYDIRNKALASQVMIVVRVNTFVMDSQVV